MSEHEPHQRREVYYSGRVQGVGFRYTVQHIASGYQVGGYVKNLFDGRVYLVAEGLPEELDRFLAAIYGRMGKYISGVQESASPASGFTEFEIRF